MNNFYIHYAVGDILYALPTIKALGGGIIYTGLSPEKHASIKRLLEAQPYIHGIYHQDEQGLPKGFINLQEYLLLNQDRRHLAQMFALMMKVKIDQSVPWITLPGGLPKLSRPHYAVLNVTARYRDKVFSWRRELAFLERNTDVAIYFLGLFNEYEAFVRKYPGFGIRYYPTADLLDAAKVIAGAKYYSGTQSSLLAIAQGLGRTYRFERSPFSWWDNCVTKLPSETILNNHTRKIHLALSRTQEILRNFMT
jgi:hypothetical protein